MSKAASIDSLTNIAKKKIANKLLQIKQEGLKTTALTDLENITYYEGASQGDIPVKDIKDGIIQTKDNRYIGIVEVLPLNFFKKSDAEQVRIMNAYAKLFKRNDYKFGVYIWSDKSNPYELIKNLENNCNYLDNPKIAEGMEEYIDFLYILGNTDAITKRFFYVFEYRGEDGRKDGNYKEIVQSVEESKAEIRRIMKECGNICVVPKNETHFAIEILYTFFNRNSSKKESVDQRYIRMKKDYQIFNELTGKHKEVTIADVLAPRGLYFDNRNYVFMDGYYYGFIGIMGDDWPVNVCRAWLERFNYGAFIDLVMLGIKQPQEITKLAIKGANKFTVDRLKSKYRKGKMDSAEKWNSKFLNNKIVFDEMNNGTSLYNCGLILVIRTYTEKDLGRVKRAIKKDLKSIDIAIDDAFLSQEDYWRMVMPLLYITPSFNVIKHNILASQLPTTYCYTAYEICDPTGFVIGQNRDNDSILAINNFNTEYYMSANMLVIGRTGAGKTFFEQLMGRRSFFNGKRCFYIIPKKGFELRKGIENLDGTYVELFPGSKDCVNIMEIRPEGIPDLSLIDEEVLVQKGSWLAKKITNILMWIQLLLGERKMNSREYNKLNVILKSIYRDYGITDDNRSIFKDKTYNAIKPMPIISDIYIRTKDDEELQEITEQLYPFVYGNCSNMNQPTNVNLNNPNIVFNIDEDVIGQRLLGPFLYIGFEFTYNEVKSNTESDDLIFLDEVWKMFVTEDCAEQVQNMVRLVRSYHGATVIATQQIQDFLNAPGDFGKTVLNNSEISLILGMKPKDLELVKKELHLSEKDCEKILSFDRGTGMLISKGDKIEVQIKASDLEKELFEH